MQQWKGMNEQGRERERGEGEKNINLQIDGECLGRVEEDVNIKWI